jgi:NAD(P)-dependent dehydrogenase (short-subunit alcohol dehydrogenase family)
MTQEIFRDDLLENQHVLVTGGSRGIGLGIARRVAEKGANLTLIARDQNQLSEASDQLTNEFGCRSLGLSSDVRDYEALEDRVQQAVDELGPIHHLICGAAGNFPAAASEMSSNAFESVVDIDLNVQHLSSLSRSFFTREVHDYRDFGDPRGGSHSSAVSRLRGQSRYRYTGTNALRGVG